MGLERTIQVEIVHKRSETTIERGEKIERISIKAEQENKHK